MCLWPKLEYVSWHDVLQSIFKQTPFVFIIIFYLNIVPHLYGGLQVDLCESKMTRQYKNFQIEVTVGGFRLCGTNTSQSSLKELMEYLAGQCLRTENVSFQLKHCCPPEPRGAPLSALKGKFTPTSLVVFYRGDIVETLSNSHIMRPSH